MSLNQIAMMAAGSPVGAVASPSTLSASISGAGTATTASTTVTASGGSGQFSYSWSAPGFTADSPATATTTFSRSLSNGESFSGTATCTVTDRQNGRTASSSVSVTLTSSSALTSGLTLTSTDRPAHPAGSSGPYHDTYRCDVSNGSGSYAYSWTISGGLGATITSGTTSQSVTFQYNMGPADGTDWFTFFQCDVTDTVTSATTRANGGISQKPG